MVTPAAGSVILVRFPFSDLSQSKLRPAVVLVQAGRDDWILCQITSKPYGDARAVQITDADFASGGVGPRDGPILTTDFTDFTDDTDVFMRVIGAIRGYGPFSAPRREWR